MKPRPKLFSMLAATSLLLALMPGIAPASSTYAPPNVTNAIGTLALANQAGPTGSGFEHVTSGARDSAANVGGANQVLLTNSGATDTAWSGANLTFSSAVGTITNTGNAGLDAVLILKSTNNGGAAGFEALDSSGNIQFIFGYRGTGTEVRWNAYGNGAGVDSNFYRNSVMKFAIVSTGTSFPAGIDLKSPQTIACGTGGTQTVAANATAGLIVTSGTLSSNCTIDFGTNATSGLFHLDMSGVTLGATFGIVFKNGTSSSSTFTSGTVISGASMAVVWTHGSNTLAVNF